MEKRVILYYDEQSKKWHLTCYSFPIIPDSAPVEPDLEFLSDEYFDAVYVAKNFLTGVLEI